MPKHDQGYTLTNPKFWRDKRGYTVTYYRNWDDGSLDYIRSKPFAYARRLGYVFDAMPIVVVPTRYTRDAWKVCQIVDANRHTIAYIQHI